MRALGLVIFCLTLCSTQLHCQAVQWAKQAISDGPIEGFDLVTDNDGNVYVAGDHTDPASFDNVVIDNEGRGTMFVTKYDPNGQALWSRSIRGSSSNQLRCMAFGNDAIYVSGYYYQTNDLSILDFGEFTVEGNPVGSLFIAEISTDGEWQWVKIIQTTNDPGTGQLTSPEEMLVLPSGDIIMSGYCTTSSVTIEGTVYPTNDLGSLFFASYAEDGTFNWFKAGEQGGLDKIELALSDNGVFFGGEIEFFQMVFDGDSLPHLENNIRSNVALGEIDATGNLIWWWPAGSFESAIKFGGLDVSPDGDLRVSLRTSGVNGVTINGVKYDATEQIETIFRIDGNGDVLSYVYAFSGWDFFTGSTLLIKELINDNSGNTYITGRLEAPGANGFTPVFFGDTIGGQGNWESFISAYDSNGSYLGVFPFSFPEANGGECFTTEMAMDPSGQLIVTGYFRQNFTVGDIDLQAINQNQMFVVKLDPTLAFGTNPTGIQEHGAMTLRIYPNPTLDKVYFEYNEDMSGVDLVIRDLLGRQMMHRTTIMNRGELDLSSLSNGSYVLSVITESGSQSQIIVKH